MLTLNELRLEIYELECALIVRDRWTERNSCINCGATVWRNPYTGRAGSLAHIRRGCGSEIFRLLNRKRTELTNRREARQYARWA